MILNVIFAALALLSLALLLWQWVAAQRFPLHQRVSDSSFAPAVTLLKSLKGADASTEDCLRSWFAQEYGGEMQILFGVASADDPVCEIVRKLMQEFPKHDAQLVVCPELIGANAKVSKLAELEKLAKHEILAVSDADVRVPADFLVNAVAPFHEAEMSESSANEKRQGADALQDAAAPHGVPGHPPGFEVRSRSIGSALVQTPADRGQQIPVHVQEVRGHPTKNLGRPAVGLVNCFYRLANPSTLAMQWEAIAINADFWSQVLQSQMLKPLEFALGAVMLTRRKFLDEIGGFKSLADCLADDYQLGNRIARNGHRIVLCPVAVECWDPPMSWRAVWKHQLRWARTIRVCQPVPYFFSILSNPTLWPLLWLLPFVGTPRFEWFFGIYLFRIAVAAHLKKRLTGTWADHNWIWLVGVKDLLQAAIWVCAFAGSRIEWRGQVFKLQRNGTLVKLQSRKQETSD